MGIRAWFKKSRKPKATRRRTSGRTDAGLGASTTHINPGGGYGAGGHGSHHSDGHSGSHHSSDSGFGGFSDGGGGGDGGGSD